MKIQLKKGPRAAFEEIEVEKGTTIEAIYKKIERELPYKILLAKVNYEYEGLDYEIRQECSVELLDMRVQAASLVYQSSLSLLYLKAIHDVLGAVDVDIENALNKGLYTEIKRDVPVTAKEVRQIQQRMEALVRADLPLIKSWDTVFLTTLWSAKRKPSRFLKKPEERIKSRCWRKTRRPKKSASTLWTDTAIFFTAAWCRQRGISRVLSFANIAAAF